MKKFTLFLFVVLLGAGGYVYWNYFNVYSDGNREGVMMKVSRKGNVFKTFEAEVMQPGFRSGAGSLTSNTFKFSATDEAVSKQYGPVATPHVFIFDAMRKLRFTGRIDDSERVDLSLLNCQPSIRDATKSVVAAKR